MATIERRLAENGGQRVLALHDAIGQLVDTGRDRATLKKQVADLKHKFEQNTAIDQQTREIATRLGSDWRNATECKYDIATPETRSVDFSQLLQRHGSCR